MKRPREQENTMPKPVWEPGQERIERANINRFIRFVREIGRAHV